ncbi:hypothetical protein EUBSIR_01862 [[Eubacterium] siraeum DSM 15702]|uniref:Uncharacterized protein n=1 Tax=[Eubacterium] siraeum DSM 15702 TaxID=428128 RepID=B0MQ52_9FIRM|nr:hypothetical protein EUBSIR_01862 [[Eubacterium] siraeum DSM 15702]
MRLLRFLRCDLKHGRFGCVLKSVLITFIFITEKTKRFLRYEHKSERK